MKSTGLTLIELCYGLFLSGLLALLAVPYLHTLWLNWEAKRVQVQLQQAITYARLTALQMGQSIVLCGSSDGEQCNGDWRGQWLAAVLVPHQVLLHWPGVGQPAQLQWQGFQREQLVFSPQLTQAASNGQFSYQCGEISWQLILNRLGKVRLVTDN